MMKIDNSCLVKMESPAKHLLALLPQAAAAVVAERKEEFWGQHADSALLFVDSPEFILNVETDTQLIRISRRVVEVTWCATYAYTTVWRLLLNSGQLGSGETTELMVGTAERTATDLLAWALTQWLNAGRAHSENWPTGTPRPQPLSDTPETELDITGKALTALAFLMQHEFAHIRLGHSGPSSIEDEKEADADAVNWFLEKCPPDAKRGARGHSIATALSILVARDIHRGRLINGTTHPRSYDRLSHGLERHFKPDEEGLWSYVSTILSLHITNSGLKDARPQDITGQIPTAYEVVQQDLNFLANALKMKE
jgi:hypothetical protein